MKYNASVVLPDNISTSVIQGRKILIVDDHKNIRIALKMTLEAEGAVVEEVEGYEKAIEKLGGFTGNYSNNKFDAVLMDIRMPDGNGIELLKKLADQKVAGNVIMISGEGSIQDAFQATHLGAFDYVEKPFLPERILISVSRCIAYRDLSREHASLAEKVRRGNIILGESEVVQKLNEKIQRVAPTNGRVLIIGQSGTGKELVAKEIHRLSQRSSSELVRVNCAAIPVSLIESELFGHEKGSFTGAHKERRGVFERADGGTLFLDEIGELELGVQAKLLRALQSGEILRVGAEKTITVDVRLIAATNRDLEEMVKDGAFREDLFYRLNVISLHVPPLKDRGQDIRLIAEEFLRQACEEHSLGAHSFSQAAMQQLMSYHWPGNVRQLKNLIERVAILSDSEEIESIDFGGAPLQTAAKSEPLNEKYRAANDETSFSFNSSVVPWQQFHEEAGRDYIKHVLRLSGGNVTEASRVLCLERAYLHRLMRKLGVQRDIVVGD